jgi:hypothetical protein
MFGWFSHSCVVDPVTRRWIDERWRWLTNEFGDDLMVGSTTVLPTAEFFPDRYDRSESAVRALLDRVCHYMQVAPALVELDFYSNHNQPLLVNEDGHPIGGAAGTYRGSDERFVIRLERSQFDRPMALVGTIAHELAHARLLGEGRLDRDAFDNELLTDLTVVFHGLGIFLANCPRHWRSDVSAWPDTDVPKPEYMTTPMYGYSLALRCRLREEADLRWKRHLVPGVRAEFKQALKFLEHEHRQKQKN